MTTLSFFLENGAITDVDLSIPELGNPGCGGTEYAIASLVKELSRNSNNNLLVYSQSKFEMENVTNVLVSDLFNAVDLAEMNGQIFVFRPYIHSDPKLLEKIAGSSISAIAWLHVTPTYEHLLKLASIPQIRALVTMSHRQFFGWLDSPVSVKTVNIVNGQYPSRVERKNDFDKTVTYLGALVPQKGFHLLAEVWPRVLEKLPNAKLNVIGSGQLYSRKSNLGEMGIAGSDYENEIVSKLGSSISSVNFLGRVSNQEKDKIISQTAVGIVNPSGLTENCPASALDFQSAGVPLVAGNKNGLIDTVLHGVTGLLISTPKELEKAILKLLMQRDLNLKFGAAGPLFVERNFRFRDVSESWENLFSAVEKNTLPELNHLPAPKGLREIYIYVNHHLGKPFNRTNLLPSYIRVRAKLAAIAHRIRRNS